MTGVARLALLVALVALVAVGCGGRARATAPGGSPRATPVASLTPALAGTVAELEAALRPQALTLRRPAAEFRPSAPASLANVPRAVYQVVLAEPDAGQVVIYELPSAAAASTEAQALAAYLGSNFGQTNFAHDAEFSVAQLGQTVVFTFWSPDRSGRSADVERAFRTVAAVGQSVPVIK
jgi:hypothetical protein